MTKNGGHRSRQQAPDLATVPGSPDACIIVAAEGALHGPDTVAAHFRGEATIRVADISTADQIKAATAGASGLVVALQRLPAELIEAIDPGVRVIGRMGIGTDTVDLEAAAACGLTVFNEPTYGVTEVASHAVAMLLALNRKLVPADRHVRQGWHAGSRAQPGADAAARRDDGGHHRVRADRCGRGGDAGSHGGAGAHLRSRCEMTAGRPAPSGSTTSMTCWRAVTR